MSTKDWGLALLVVFAWGINFVIIRFGLEELPPLLLGALRFALVAFPAIFFVKRPAIPLRLLLSYGITISFGQFALLFLAMHNGMPAGLASLVLQSQMLFTLIFARFLLNERWQLQQFLAIGVAGAGLALLASQTSADQMTFVGFILTIAAASCWGMGNIINRKIAQLGKINLMSLIVWSGLLPIIPFTVASYLFEGPELIVSSLTQASVQSFAVVLYLAAIATLFGYGSWAYLMRHYPASQVAPLTMLVPVVGLLTAWIVLDETLSMIQGAGIALIMAGLMINTFGSRIIKQLKALSAA
ncbi:EamA family transporter [Neptunomonas phycophila]|uniref:EamA family transporter n=1 Tax=Neptunomonas phycophila TaxID=1572645 RepID=A0AAW7XCK6_9GAMM|nr:EamA family transporter [Neptunomonas phycophila]MDO6451948.1 EamA family transporter [Neptunomonas phycophila]MDP2524363.1 EamA family transporter [Neptunomonas phycophila]